MILPIGDAPNPTGYMPWVTWLLIAANVLVYVFLTLPMGLQIADPAHPLYPEYVEYLRTVVSGEQLALALGQVSQWDLFVFAFGYRPGAPSFVDLFASMFMHAGFAHLGGNMLFLWIYGDNVEYRLGRVGYLLAYLGSGVVATLSFAALAGASDTPLVGASGAISGVLGLYFVAYPQNVVKMLIGIPPFFFNVILLPAWVVLAAYVVFNNLFPLLSGAASNVAYGAHLGGFVAGVLVGLPVVYGARWLGGRPAPASGSSSGSVLEQAAELRQRGQVQQALQLLGRAASRAQGAERAELQLAIGELLADQGYPTDAYQWLMRALQHPATAQRARRALQALRLDPRLQSRLGL